MTDLFRVCFVCTGNICRSPTAEVVFREFAERAGLADRLLIDSAGTGPWHAGHDMDPRARHTLLSRGYQPHDHVAKQFLAEDFDERDAVLAIDSGHLARLGRLALLAADPEDASSSLSLLRGYDPLAVRDGDLDVPDPYYDDARGFELVLDQVERACAGLLAAVRPQLG